MTTEISVMYGSEKVNVPCLLGSFKSGRYNPEEIIILLRKAQTQYLFTLQVICFTSKQILPLGSL